MTKHDTPEINEKIIAALPLPEKGSRIHYFSGAKLQGQVAPGSFGCRVTAGGTKTFILTYRNERGQPTPLKIGTWPTWTAIRAIKEAKKQRQLIDKGYDPQAAKREKREGDTVSDLCDRYTLDHLPNKRESSQRDDTAMIKQIIKPRLGSRRIVDVEYTDVDKLHKSMRDHPYRGNRVLALLSKMFSLAIRWKLRGDNPCKGVDRFQEAGRERYLKDGERARLMVAMQEHANKGKTEKQTVTALRLAMLTGARIGEVLSATWDQFDLEAATWTKPAATTKQKKLHRVVLNAPTRALLAEMGGDEGYLFPNPQGTGRQKDYKRSWAAILKAARIKNLRVHDLRHNFASEGVSAGLSLPMIGALLGHTSPQTTQRYAHLMDDPLRAATERIGSRITGAEPVQNKEAAS